MANVTVTYPGGDRETVVASGTYADLAKALGKRIGRDVVAVAEDDAVVDLARAAKDGASARFVTLDSPEGAEVLRHSAAHVMAEAVQALFPGTKVTIGPAIENGFYYDFDAERPFTPEDFEAIEARMRETIAKNAPFTRREVSRDEAAALFGGMGETYKVEILRDLPEDAPITLYEHNGWVDLCRGPHLPGTGQIQAFKLLSVAGAYWRGDERNPMLSRIYGLAFPDEKALKAHLAFLEEAKRRDHRRLGKELELFLLSEDAGAGLPIWLPKGARLRAILEQWEREEHFRRGYDIVMGPQILKTDLWVRSGHYDHYRENMYFTEVEGQGYGVKPMNCLAHMLIYKSKTRSFRDLPLRFFELGTVHRHEKSGVLHGLLRVRSFTQDDAHILCTPEQLVGEIQGVIGFVAETMAKFGFEYLLELSTRPEHSIGSDADWDRATDALSRAMTERGLPFEVNEGDGAFYGPKIDVKLKDCLGRLWQCATIQCDFTMPERFDLEYVGSDNRPHRPVMVHRVILGSIERFIGVLIEHYAGAFPAWLAPVQAVVLPITDAQNEYADGVRRRLVEAGFRAEADLRNEKVGYKIREASKQKVPYMLVVGEKEKAAGAVAPRTRKGEDRGAMPLDAFMETLRAEING